MVRIKERYLLVNILYPEVTKKSDVPDLVVYHQPTPSSLTPPVLLRGIRAEVGALFGDYGLGSVESGLSVKYLSHATSTFILRVSRAHYRLAWAALTCMNRLPGKDSKRCVFRVVRVSGTIRKAEEEAIRRAKQLILAAGKSTAAQAASSQPSQQQHDLEMLDVEDDYEDMSEGDYD